MGAGNVGVVCQRWSRSLNDKPFRVLVQMAQISMDEDSPPHYWGGWAMLARAAGAEFPAGCERCHGCDGCQAAQQTVYRAVRALVSCGLITVVEKARPGRNAKYALCIHVHPGLPSIKRYGPGIPVDNSAGSTPREDTASSLSVRHTPDAEQIGTPNAERGKRLTPGVGLRSTKEEPKEYKAGTNSALVGTSPAHPPESVDLDVMRR